MKSTKRRNYLGQLRHVHPFPARMAPEIALSQMASQRRLRILDPMVGSGTSVVLASMLGHIAKGYDCDPLALLIASAWCSKLNETAFRSRLAKISATARKTWRNTGSYPPSADLETKEFLRYWFDFDTRKKLAAISSLIHDIRGGALRTQLWCVFSRLIIVKDKGVSLAKDVSHSRPHRSYERAPADCFALFLRTGEQLIRTMKALPPRRRPVCLQKADARKLPVKTGSIDLVITSPPYLNAIDYIRGHRLSLTWMGYTIRQVRDLRRSALGAEAGCESVPEHLSVARNAMGEVQALAPRLQRMVNKYVIDMNAVMAELARVLKPNGRAVIVIGNSTLRGTFLKNSNLVAELARLHGLTPSGRRWRRIPTNRRYLPPPSSQPNATPLAARMRKEVVLTFINNRLGQETGDRPKFPARK